MMMLGSTISAEFADQLGLINHVVDDDQVMTTASEIALQLCDGPQAALRGTKFQLTTGLNLSLHHYLK